MIWQRNCPNHGHFAIALPHTTKKKAVSGTIQRYLTNDLETQLTIEKKNFNKLMMRRGAGRRLKYGKENPDSCWPGLLAHW